MISNRRGDPQAQNRQAHDQSTADSRDGSGCALLPELLP